MNPYHSVVGCLMIALVGYATALGAEPTREEKVRADKAKVEAEGFWIYNDLPKAMAEAKRSGKPLLVNLRCIPCEECVKLDDDLVDRDPTIRPLLEKFVCVRIVGTNGLDLSLFQYDTDQSFAMFLMNVDGTIYGRFGTRSHRTEWVGDVSLEGMARALEGALELHAAYPSNKQALVGKRGKSLEFARPELYPALKDKYTSSLDYAGNVVKSCIHCHQIGDARREFYRSQGQAVPEELLYSYPHPKSVGLILDPQQRATVTEVKDASPAAAAGILPNDNILSLNGQPLLSMADVQWVLHSTDPNGGTIMALVERAGKTLELPLVLKPNWRHAEDLSWRASSWGMRRMVTGGMVLKVASPEERAAANIADSAMCLKVDYLGEYGPHRAAIDAGFQKGDLIISFDDQIDLMNESDLFRFGMTRAKPGDQIDVVVMREGKRKSLKLPMQE